MAGTGVAQAADSAPSSVSFSAYHDLIQAIVAALEARDPHTAEHSLRVGDMAERTCRLMGLPEAERDAIHMAAHMHDIGKIGIPDSILLKRSRLTPEEHAVLRDHARIGAEIIGSCSGLADIADIVRHHHENWDGSGFPDGLAGEDIPLGSRVIAVVDSIDAMLGKRLAKRSLTQGECIQQVFINKGVKYDPRVAQFVLDHWDEVVGPVNFRDSHDFEGDESGSARSLHCAVPPVRAALREACGA